MGSTPSSSELPRFETVSDVPPSSYDYRVYKLVKLCSPQQILKTIKTVKMYKMLENDCFNRVFVCGNKCGMSH